MPDCDLEGRIFLPLTLTIDSFSCTPFISERRFLNTAVNLIADVPRQYCDDNTAAFDDIITFNDVAFNDGILDVHYNQSISNT